MLYKHKYPIHGEFSGDASAGGGVVLKLFRQGDSGLTQLSTSDLAADEGIAITDILLVSAAGGACGLFADTDADGRRVVKGTFAANNGVAMHFATPRALPKKTFPKVVGPGVQTDCIIEGFIYKGGK